MGVCKYCGERAGLLSTAHKECREAHERATTSIRTLLRDGLKSDVSPSALKHSAQEVAAAGRVSSAELRRLVLGSMARWIDEALGDHILSHEEEKRLSDFTDTFDIQVEDLDDLGYRTKLVKGQILRDLSEGRMPRRVNINGPLPISLSKGENVIFVFQNTEYQKVHARYQYVGGSAGTSVRLMKGVYLRSSGFKGERIRTEELKSVGKGHLILTNKNLFFYGPEVVRTPLKKIVGVQPYTDGIAVHRDGHNVKPMVFMLDDPLYATNLISLTTSLN